jgi:hypothetical protein
MSKFSKLFKAIGLIMKQPALLNKVIDDADVNMQMVVRKYNLPKGLKTISLTDLLADYNVTVSPFSALDGGSTPIDLSLLKGLAASIKDCNYFEIGTWRGESVANVASVSKQCVTLNLPDDELLRMGVDKRYVASHRLFSKNLNNVTHVQANSQAFDFSKYNAMFDLIFIDGDHHYESVKNDTTNAFKLLKDENSIIVWHDYGNTPNDIRWDVLRGILDGTPANKQQYLYRVSNTLCAIYTTKPLKATYPDAFAFPDKTFSINISSKPVSF